MLQMTGALIQESEGLCPKTVVLKNKERRVVKMKIRVTCNLI